MEQDAYHQSLLDRQEHEANVTQNLTDICRKALLSAPIIFPLTVTPSLIDGSLIVQDRFGTRYTITIKPE